MTLPQKALKELPASATNLTTSAEPTSDPGLEAEVPTVQANLVQSIQLLPHQSLVVKVSFAGGQEANDSEAYLLEPVELKSGLQVEPFLLSLLAEDGFITVVTNSTGCSMSLEKGSLLREG